MSTKALGLGGSLRRAALNTNVGGYRRSGMRNGTERIELSEKPRSIAYFGEAVSDFANPVDARLMCVAKQSSDTIPSALYFYGDIE